MEDIFVSENETVTCEQMKKIEKWADEHGVSYEKMMENAGKAAVSIILEKYEKVQNSKKKPDFVIFCGRGNNGGDGFVTAWDLAAKGYDVNVVLADENPRTREAINNANIVLRRGITVIDAKEYFHVLPDILEAADIIIDGIYGTGFHGELKKRVRRCTKLINDSKKLVFALDIPSGLNGDTGEPDPDTVKADYTITFHRKKPVHDMNEMKPWIGEILRADIGIEKL